ncbi:MAG TPA: amino acid adenylation domain-containing protein, partial [Thermoanaerobaculia bacterium]|nr:amino acid adenylation domain-containing protein [Thermoanaerobaculia bacterium]
TAAYVAPRTPLEAALAEAWREVLGVERVGVDDSFFALGGDSISSLRLRARAEQRGARFSIPQLFRSPTVAGLAREIAAAAGPGGDATAAAAEERAAPFALIAPADRARLPVGLADAYPLSRLQLGMLFHSDRDLRLGLYHDLFTYRLSAPLDLARLRQAWLGLLRRHPVLRTSFDLVSYQEPLQLVHRRAELPIAVLDLRPLAPAAQASELAAWRRRERTRPYVWSRAPLSRVTVHDLAEQRCQLSVSFHHAILDGWSVATLLTELGGALGGGPDPGTTPPPLASSFADFIALERSALAAGESRSFWLQRLAGDPPASIARWPGASGSARSVMSAVGRRVPAEVMDGLQRLAASLGVPLKSSLLAAHLRVLGWLSGEAEVLTGLVANGRPEAPDGDRVLGLFLNTLPLRFRLPRDSYEELVRQAFAAEQEMLPHRRFPLAEIKRLLGGLTLDSAFNFVHFHVYTTLADDGRLGVLAGEVEETTDFPLTTHFQIEPFSGAVGLEIRFDAAHFPRPQMELAADYYLRALAILAAAPRQRCDGGVPLAAAERQQLLVEWEAGRWPAARPAGWAGDGWRLDELFARQAAARPEAVAVVCGSEQLPYGELLARAERLAHRLAALGVGPEARVALCLERSVAMVVAILAVLRAGGAYVPIEPESPRERQELMLRDSAAAVLVVGAGVETAPRGAPAAGVLVVDDAGELVADDAAAAGADAAGPGAAGPGSGGRQWPAGSAPSGLDDALAYVIYTSGSTGRPKGVGVTHRNVVRLFSATAERFGFGPDDVWTLFHSYAFDFSVWELWGALLYGGRLVVVPYFVSRTPEQFARLLATQAVTVLNQTPSAFRQLAASGQPHPALRWVIFGGEALEPARLTPWLADRQAAPGPPAPPRGRPRLVNMYGITETTVHVTYRELRAEDARRPGVSPVGRALPDLAVYLLDAGLAPVPIGVPGEICVAGPGVARGYLGRPELTAERFVPDALGGEAGTRLYRSGDLARRRPTGELDYLGRRDHQVKVRGFRIELGEIEHALLAHPTVADAVVAAPEEAGGARRLVAYVVPRGGAAPAAGELRRHLARQLPESMLPAAWVFLERLPLTANGKVDRRALPPPDGARAAATAAYVAPRTPLEAALAEAWREVLGVERVGVDDSFFALGGDSISSLRLRLLAERRGMSFGIQQLFQNPTVGALAQAMSTAAAAPAATTAAAGGPASAPYALLQPADRRRLPAGVVDACPLSALQQGMLFHSELHAAQGMYHDVLSHHLQLACAQTLLRRALGQLAARHPMLRTAFELSDFSEPLQLVYAEVEVPFAAVDLRRLAAAAQEEQLRVWLRAESKRPFDWRRAPLLRVHLHRRSEKSFQLTLTFHHAILDGWSLATLVTELFQIYLALLGGAEPRLAEPPMARFADFVALEREAVASAAQREHWLRQVGGGVAPLPRWPSARAAAAATFARTRELVPDPLRQRLERLGAALAVPLKSVLLAAHLAVVRLLTGSDEPVTGVIANGRPEQADGDRALGLFLNTVPLRLRLTGLSWRELIARVFAAETESLPYRRYPLVELRRALGGRQPFAAVFNFVHFHVYDQLIDRGEIAVLSGGFSETAEFPLIAGFGIDPLAGGLELQLEHDVALLAPAQMRAIRGYYLSALAAIAAAPGASCDSWTALSAAERHQLLREWNDTPAVAVVAGSLVDRIAARAAPAALAAICGERRLTYRQLAERSDLLAHALVAAGVGPEVVVGICVERSLALAVGLLAVLKAGGAFLPLDPSHPGERLAFMLADAGAPVLLTEPALAQRPWPGGLELVLCDREGRVLPRQGRAAGAPRAVRAPAPENLAYVIYTSGSTGRPKGTLVAHAALAAYAQEAARHLGLGRDDRFLQFAPPSFDVMIEEILPIWLAGGAVVLPRRPGPLSLGELRRELEASRVTVAELPTAYWQEWVEELAGQGPGLPRWLRLLIVGGERMSPAALAKWRRFDAAPALLNVFGVTEATVTSSFGRLAAGAASDRFPIGRPLGGVRLLVLDDRGEPVPAGVTGELAIGGALLARGYLGRPELTAERFVPDPHGGEAGARSYRTGDRARQDPDGAIDLLGRGDRQVKVRGSRVELAEVEAAILRHPAVLQAAVALREDRPPDKVLTAYLVADCPPDRARPLLAELRELLGRELPEFMRPAAFVMLPALPLTAHGKVDRQALPAPFAAVAATAPRAFRPPRTPLEEIVAALWQDVLAVARVGVDEDFFALGGDSLSATRLISRLRRTLDLELPLAALFEEPTVDGLARRVEEARGAVDRQPPPPPIRPRLDRSPGAKLPLSFSQQQLWLTEQLHPGSAVYAMPEALAVRGPFDEAALARGLTAVVRRHEVLRTVYRPGVAAPVQVVQPAPAAPLRLVDLSALAAVHRERESRRLLAAEAGRGFDLARGPVLRVTLLRLGAMERVLLLNLHHIAGDAWSLHLLVRELLACYRAFALDEPPLQYADFAVWQREWWSPDRLEPAIAYWRRQLAGAPALLSLPTDRPRAAARSSAGAERAWRLSPELAAGLGAFSGRNGSTLFMNLLAGFFALLARYSGETDLVVGTSVAGRETAETEELIGCLINTVALRADLAGDPGFAGLVARVRRLTLQAHANAQVPFERVVQELAPERSLGHAPLFQLMFVLQNAPTAPIALPGLSVSRLPLPVTTAKFDLTLVASAVADGLFAAISYQTGLFDPTTVERLSGHFERLLTAAVTEPELRVSELTLLAAAEWAQLVREWNDTGWRDAPARPIHEWIEEHARRCPDALALAGMDEQLSYGMLEARASALAHRLRQAGVGPEVRVALLLPRSPALVTALVAVLKAGGAFVPLDPAWPRERLAWLLEDAGPAVVLAAEELIPGLPATRARVLGVADEGPPTAAGSWAGSSGLENLAYVLYTSGSTGLPKGVMVSHRGLAHYLGWCLTAYPVAAGWGCPLHSPLAFDLTLTSLLAPLVSGRAVLLLPEKPGGEALAEALAGDRSYSLVKLTPAHLEVARQLVMPQALRGRSRSLVVGGEALTHEAIDFWLEHAPETRIFNEYGPTETVVGCCVHEVAAGAGGRGPVPIGRPIANTCLLLLDRGLQPVPIGVPGEIFIGGGGLARGYLGRPDLTADRFVPDPFSERPGNRLYRTGDLARRRHDGVIEFLGRTDRQLKVRGFRVEPAEIEAALRRHPAVQEALVRLDRSDPEQPRLVAYALTPSRPPPPEAELRRLMVEALPEPMVPAAIVALPAWPLTPNGKVDLQALPRPRLHALAVEAARAEAAPLGVMAIVAQIWAELLGVDAVPADGDFFALGATSITALQLGSRLRACFQLQISFRSVFERPRLGAFAAWIESQLAAREAPAPAAKPAAGGAGGSALVALAGGGEGAPLFCVHPAGGTVFCYEPLARHLGGRRPCYGLQAEGIDMGTVPLRSVEAMASRYLEVVLALRPAGPYLLAGWSFGGLVAFEMAHQLARQGRQVELLALLDCHVPAPVDLAGPALARFQLRGFARELGIAEERLGPADGWGEIGAGAADPLPPVLVEASRRGLLPPGADRERLRSLFDVFRANFDAQLAYRPRRYAGPLTVLQAAAGQGPADLPAAAGWLSLAPAIEVRDLPGDHFEIVREPHVVDLARELRRCLDRADPPSLDRRLPPRLVSARSREDHP